MGELIGSFDWERTGLGELASWPSEMLRTVSLALRSAVPIVTLWGERGIIIYNDAYRRFAGERHPSLLGRPALQGWPEAAEFNANVMERVYGANETLSYKDQNLVTFEDGIPRCVRADLDCSPIHDRKGKVVGVFASISEMTSEIEARRECEPVMTGARDSLAEGSFGTSQRRPAGIAYQPVVEETDAIEEALVPSDDVTQRQEASADGQAFFRTFAKTLPNHIWTAKPDGSIEWVDDKILAFSGQRAAQLIGSGWTAMVHPDDALLASKGWQSALLAGETFEYELRARRHDGEYRWFLVRAVPAFDGQGNIVRWVGTNTDIHEHKRNQAETTADRDRMWSLSRDVMLVCTFDGIITAVNPSASRLLEWEEDELVGEPLAAFLHPADLEATREEVSRLSRGITTVSFENRYRTKGGDYRLLSWTAVPEVGRIHAVGRDITEEREHARERERMWGLSPVMMVVTGDDGRIIDVNPVWTRLLGWSREETVGKRSTDFMRDDESAWHERVKTLAGGEPMLDYETYLNCRDGSQRLIKWSAVPDDGKFYGFGRDVTPEREAALALEEAEAALRQAQKMEAVGQLTGGIAHDFNNLLQGVTGSLDLVKRRIEQKRFTEIERFVTSASTEAGRAAALTHRLLAFARRQPLDPRPLDTNGLIASMEDLLRRTIGVKITLELGLAGGLWMTKCDQNQLESALLNLAINARDAMPEGGRLTIGTCNAHLDSAYAARQRGVRNRQYVCISVTDTGVGMDADTVAKAFEPFFTTKPIGQGTGLGLSMIYGFAQQSEGYAKIYSEVGSGTTFKLYLPRFIGLAEADEAAPQLHERRETGEGQVVLVIEDEPVVRGLIAEELSELGYHALEAADGPSGLAILQSSQRLDLLVTDIGLPGLNGRQVVDAARQVRPDLKVLFMTGYAETAAMASGFLEPGMEMITKPFTMEAFADRIRAMIQKGLGGPGGGSGST
ncbi:PAS domain S-box protein [Novosphingobium lindaniclasticum]|uniref:PAS domain S-box protein n=1 Tax=Novosphingobium lindaniclasticum TaxID=1329895 RepID=UPI00240A0023|nr:PAS domain S-box protein [Novosphingobium lindaniclasticum]